MGILFWIPGKVKQALTLYNGQFFLSRKKIEKLFFKMLILLVIFFLHTNDPDEKEATACFTEGRITALESE